MHRLPADYSPLLKTTPESQLSGPQLDYVCFVRTGLHTEVHAKMPQRLGQMTEFGTLTPFSKSLFAGA
jgi:hypothetical protein